MNVKKAPDGVLGHFSKSHKHIEFIPWRLEDQDKKISTALGYIMLTNTTLVIIMLVIDIVALVQTQDDYN